MRPRPQDVEQPRDPATEHGDGFSNDPAADALAARDAGERLDERGLFVGDVIRDRELLVLIVPYDHERIELSLAKDFAHMIDSRLALTDAITQNIKGDLARHIRAGLCNQFVEAARPAILVKKTPFGVINLGVASEVLCRAVQ